MREWHILGNGDKAVYYLNEKRNGKTLLCNMPPFEVPSKLVYATVMVDFKMMAALTDGSITIDQYMWVLGNRPKMWMEGQPSFYLKYASNIKEFYLTVPSYCGEVGTPKAATNFNCGHMAVHYACTKHKADVVNIYGFDTLFDFNMRSVTDLYLSSDRTDTNNYRLLNIWRPVWTGLFNEFPNTEFILHHNHDALKIPKLDNVSIKVYNDPINKKQLQSEPEKKPTQQYGLDTISTEDFFKL